MSGWHVTFQSTYPLSPQVINELTAATHAGLHAGLHLTGRPLMDGSILELQPAAATAVNAVELAYRILQKDLRLPPGWRPGLTYVQVREVPIPDQPPKDKVVLSLIGMEGVAKERKIDPDLAKALVQRPNFPSPRVPLEDAPLWDIEAVRGYQG